MTRLAVPDYEGSINFHLKRRTCVIFKQVAGGHHAEEAAEVAGEALRHPYHRCRGPSFQQRLLYRAATTKAVQTEDVEPEDQDEEALQFAIPSQVAAEGLPVPVKPPYKTYGYDSERGCALNNLFGQQLLIIIIIIVELYIWQHQEENLLLFIYTRPFMCL